ncbi:MAG: UvrD-helicase domain-containing protein, partial [Pseudomonadota bacterium]
LRTCMLVEAAAGTGKTTMMVTRMVALLANGECEIRNIAAVTFTRKAAAELRSRFQVNLEQAAGKASGPARPRLQNALSNIEKCFVGTIHSFCGRLLRERPVEAGLDPSFREIDQEEDEVLREQAWEEYADGLYSRSDPLLDDLQYLGVKLNDLRNGFGEYIDNADVPEWPVEPAPPMDWDEVRRLLAEVRGDAEEIAAHLSTSFKDQDQLQRKFAKLLRMIRHTEDSNETELMNIVKELRVDSKAVMKKWSGRKDLAKAMTDRWAEHRKQAKDLLRRWSRCAYPAAMQAVQGAYAVYRDIKRARGVVSLQDLLTLAAELLRENPHVRLYFADRFQRLLVDEFQDTDPIQAEVMMLLTAKNHEETNWRNVVPREGSLFVVGDPKQSIYRFRRADIQTYGKVKEILERNGQLIVRLKANFRSSIPVIDWVNDTFKKEFKGPSEEQPEYVELLPGGSHGSGHGDPHAVMLHVTPKGLNKDEIARHEADIIARHITASVGSGGPVQASGFDDFLIVAARKDRLGEYGRKLQEYGIPHEVTGGDSLNRSREVGLLSDCLRAVYQPENPVALVAALRGGLFGISDDCLYRFKRAGGEFSFLSDFPSGFDHPEADSFAEAYGKLKKYRSWLQTFPAVAAMELMAGDLGLLASAAVDPEGNSRVGGLMKVLEILRSLQRGVWSVGDLADFLEDVAKSEKPKHKYDSMPAVEAESPAVRVMNLHKVKGLEAPVVFLADPTGRVTNRTITLHIDRSGPAAKGYLGFFDPDRDRYPPEIALPVRWETFEAREKDFQEAERTRLLYVGTTRARERLIVTQRDEGGYNNYNPWQDLKPYLTERKPFPDPGRVEPLIGHAVEITDADVALARQEIEDRCTAAAAPTYSVASVKQISAHRVTTTILGTQQGTEWGSVIHTLLENLMLNEKTDLRELARTVLLEEGFADTETWLDDAVETVRAVTESDLWARSRRSSQCLVEVPFQIPFDGVAGGAGKDDTILRGAIDLVFREKDGWVIVDYKSDRQSGEGIQGLIEKYRGQILTYAAAWEGITGEKVIECGLYFTFAREYHTIE